MADLFAEHPFAAVCLGIAVLGLVVILAGIGLAYLFEDGGRQAAEHDGGMPLPRPEDRA